MLSTMIFSLCGGNSITQERTEKQSKLILVYSMCSRRVRLIFLPIADNILLSHELQ